MRSRSGGPASIGLRRTPTATLEMERRGRATADEAGSKSPPAGCGTLSLGARAGGAATLRTSPALQQGTRSMEALAGPSFVAVQQACATTVAQHSAAGSARLRMRQALERTARIRRMPPFWQGAVPVASLCVRRSRRRIEVKLRARARSARPPAQHNKSRASERRARRMGSLEIDWPGTRLQRRRQRRRARCAAHFFID